MSKVIDVTQTHPVWDSMIDKWNFYMDSYVGGDSYVKPVSELKYNSTNLSYDGSYLFPHELECEDQTLYINKFKRRHLRSVYENYCAAPINDLTKYLFSGKDEISRIYTGQNEPDRNYSPYVNDIDLRGTSIDAYMTQVSRLTAVMGLIHIKVDKKPLPQNIITLDEQKKAKIRAYTSTIDPRSMINWSVDNDGYYNWCLIKVKATEDSDYSKVREISTEYELWTKDEIYLLDEKGKAKDGYPVRNELGMVPIITLRFLDVNSDGLPESFLTNIAPLNREYYNVYSLYQEEMYKLAFAQLLVKAPSDILDTNDDQRNMQNVAQMMLGVDVAFEFHDMPPQYLVFPTGALVEKRENLDRIRENIKDISTLGQLGGSEPQQNKSGFAIWMSQTGAFFTVAQYAAKMEEAEGKIWDLIYRYDHGLVDGEIDVVYPKEYQDSHTQMDLETYRLIDEIPGSPLLNIINNMVLANEGLPLSDEENLTIKKQLKEYNEKVSKDQLAITVGEQSALENLKKEEGEDDEEEEGENQVGTSIGSY